MIKLLITELYTIGSVRVAQMAVDIISNGGRENVTVH